MAKISSILIGMVVSGFILIMVGLFISNMNTKYAVDRFSSAEFKEVETQMQAISNLTTEIKNESVSAKVGSSSPNILEALFGSVYKAGTIAGRSTDLFITLSNTVVRQNKYIYPYVFTFFGIIIFIMVVFVLLKYVFKVNT